jgi:hypothetical protein
MKTDIKVTGVRYFQTRRGTGYEASTSVPGVKIWNDGCGGCTYLDWDNVPDDTIRMLGEAELEKLIDDFEERYKKPSIMYLVAYMKHKDYRTSDHYEVFEKHKEAKERYEELLEEEWLHSASIARIIESTDYDYNKIVKEENNNAKLVS